MVRRTQPVSRAMVMKTVTGCRRVSRCRSSATVGDRASGVDRVVMVTLQGRCCRTSASPASGHRSSECGANFDLPPWSYLAHPGRTTLTGVEWTLEQAYDAFPRIEQAFADDLDASLSPRG